MKDIFKERANMIERNTFYSKMHKNNSSKIVYCNEYKTYAIIGSE